MFLITLHTKSDETRTTANDGGKKKRGKTLTFRPSLSLSLSAAACAAAAPIRGAPFEKAEEAEELKALCDFIYRRLCQNERGDIVVVVVESVRQSRPVAKTPSAHADVQTHVPGVLFRRGHVRNLLRLREGEGQEEDALKKRRGVKELV